MVNEYTAFESSLFVENTKHEMPLNKVPKNEFSCTVICGSKELHKYCTFRIRAFTWKKGKVVAVINYHCETINCVHFAGDLSLHDDVNILMCGSKDGTISIWKLL